MTRRTLLATPLALAAADAPSPVLVELFTSEGCSSCPPADRLLAELERTAPVPLIALSEHVDYWDRLGWRDPFSSPAFTRRQHAYAARFRLDSVYTPQMVVDGRAQFVGSDKPLALTALREASRRPKLPLVIRSANRAPDRLSLAIDWPDAPDSTFHVALVQPAVSTQVPRGENAGRTLPHVAVARDLRQLPRPQRDLTLPLPAAWADASLFVQSATQSHILAAAQAEA